MHSAFVCSGPAPSHTATGSMATAGPNFPMPSMLPMNMHNLQHLRNGIRPNGPQNMFMPMPFATAPAPLVQQQAPSLSATSTTAQQHLGQVAPNLTLPQRLHMEMQMVYNMMQLQQQQQQQQTQQFMNPAQPINNMFKRPLVASNNMSDLSTPAHQVSDMMKKRARLVTIDLPKRRSDADETDSCSSSSQGANTNGEKMLTFAAKKSEPGERRLHIHFLNYGKKGDKPQFHGKFRFIIPDGLRGMLTLYNEEWETELKHHAPVQFHSNVVRIEWIVVSLATMERVSVIETENEALLRQTTGRTIANNVFKKALDARVESLKIKLTEEENDLKRANIDSMIRLLSPVRFTQGPLAFGLLHRFVQERFLPESS